MTKGWDWVIGTGLYVAALVLTWLTLFSIERFGATDVKAWAPFLQAVLSAAAIFTAFWLQSQKRSADRKDARHDTLHTILSVLAQMEWTAAGTLKFRLKGDVDVANVRNCVDVLSLCDGMIRRQNFGHLDDEARARVLDLLLLYNQIGGFMAARLAHNGDKPKLALSSVYLRTYRDAFEIRSDLEETFNVDLLMQRIEPAELIRPDDPKDALARTNNESGRLS